MLDWEDEELASILWGKIPETEDHIVPYPEGNEGSQSASPHKELNKEPSSHDLEIKRAPDKTSFCGWGNENNSVFNSNTEKSVSCLGTEPWKDPHSSTDLKSDHDSVGTNLAGIAGTTLNLPSSGAGATRLDQDSETSLNQLEKQENGDFVDYSWADIGSFDDLDKIFSTDDPIFGHAGLGSVDELWSSQKDAGNNLENFFPSPVESLTSPPESFENLPENNKTRTGYAHHNNKLISDHGNLRDFMSCDYPDVDILCNGGKTELKLNETRGDWMEKGSMLSSPILSSSTLNKVSNKVNMQKKMKNRKILDQKIKGKSLLCSYRSQYPPGNQSQQFGKPEATSMMQSDPFSEPTQLRHGAVQCGSNQFSVPLNFSHCSSLLKTSHAPLKPLFMTPQEKIDKLRRRQQMQAMLAIKKQQQELNHQASETPSMPPLIEPSCPSDKEIANKITKAVNDFPVEDSALSQLQDIISKLDIQVRLCIRDSLFRLATSAAQRHYPIDTASANSNAQDEDNNLAKDNISNHNRSVLMVDAETQTNPIDRTVAHLLFHRPFDVTAKHSETPKLSVSAQPLPDSKTDSLVGIGTECSKDSAGPKQSLPRKKFESSFLVTEPQLGKELLDRSCMDISKNASNNEPQHNGALDPPTPRIKIL
uniref:Protein LNK2 n=1 Tax=Kalanchoe fedtschenkoi TaxID=63787 RepID=A0A7N1A752_KALFE